MTVIDTHLARKPFIAGTTGWTADDLDDPAGETQWLAGRYEIIEGVLTTMPPAYFYGHECAANLLLQLQLFVKQNRLGGSFAFEVDIVINQSRVVRGDIAYLSAADRDRQKEAARSSGHRDLRRTRIIVPPSLLVEATSVGHEAHDRQTKFSWYADFGIPHYWILDPINKTLECWSLRDGAYAVDCAGTHDAVLSPSLFPGLAVSLADVWPE